MGEIIEEKAPTMLESLAKIAKEMPVIGRNKRANVGKFSYNYANLEKVWEVAYPVISKNGFTVMHMAETDKVTTIAKHVSGKEISSSILISQSDPQKKGGEISYYKRYNLCMLFNIIIADEDKDAKNTEEITKERLATITEELELVNTLEELSSYYRQLGSPKDKKVLAIFTARKKSL